MPVQCRVCKELSNDTEFCDHCNADLGDLQPNAEDQRSLLTFDGGITAEIAWSSETSWHTQFRIGKYAQYRLYQFSEQSWEQWEDRVVARRANQANFLASIDFLPNTSDRVVYAEGLQSPSPLSLPSIRTQHDLDWLDCLSAVKSAIGPVVECLMQMNRDQYVWLNFDPTQIQLEGNAVQLTNLDLQLFPFKYCPDILRISKLYSPPEVVRFDSGKIGPSTDVFHLGAWLFYFIAGKNEGLSTEGLSSFEWRFPPLRIYQPSLPPGIAPVIERALNLDPMQRYPDVESFWECFCNGLSLIEKRCSFDASLDLTLKGSALTVAGPAKEAMLRENQDCVVMIQRNDALTALVADGVSTAVHGSGEMASRIACDTIVEHVDNIVESGNASSFSIAATTAFSEASLRIVEEALKSDKPLETGDLMSTTASLVLIKKGNLFISNVGDSRVYLLSNKRLEVLTIDGDLATECIIKGEPPEVAIALGETGKALKTYLGGTRLNPESEALPSHPTINSFKLLPSEIILVCSDGLIEEGVFLEPSEAEKILNNLLGESPEDIVNLLVDQAASRQRLPSEQEPQGYGDNISCIVIKVESLSPAP